MMNNLVVLPLLIPLLAGLIMAMFRKNIPFHRWFSLFSFSLTFAVSLYLIHQVSIGGIQILELGGWPAPFGIVLVDDMRIISQDNAKLSVYSTMTARISTAGIIAGVLLVLFGIFTATMLYFMPQDALAITGNGIFIVAGGTLITYSLLTRETSKKYAMNKIRAGLYALSIGFLLFAVFTGIASRYSTGEMYIAVASLMVFSLIGVGLFLFLILTGTDRRKNR
jgi:hypothetical protein